MVSSAPDISPDSTKEQNNESKYWGYLRKASAKVLPPSTSRFRLITTSRIAGFSKPSATISKLRIKGTPAFIMVASCRVKIVISNVVTFFLNSPSKIFLRFWRIVLMVIPCLRKVTFARAIFLADNSPTIFPPFRSTPS